jgi:hypothetical protein
VRALTEFVVRTQSEPQPSSGPWAIRIEFMPGLASAARPVRAPAVGATPAYNASSRTASRGERRSRPAAPLPTAGAVEWWTDLPHDQLRAAVAGVRRLVRTAGTRLALPPLAVLVARRAVGLVVVRRPELLTASRTGTEPIEPPEAPPPRPPATALAGLFSRSPDSPVPRLGASGPAPRAGIVAFASIGERTVLTGGR